MELGGEFESCTKPPPQITASLQKNNRQAEREVSLKNSAGTSLRSVAGTYGLLLKSFYKRVTEGGGKTHYN